MEIFIVNKRIYLSFAIVFFLLSTGCVSIEGQPDSPMNPDNELKLLTTYFEDATIRSCRETTDLQQSRICRDKIINGRIQAINIKFNLFEKELAREGITSGVLVDWAVLGLNSAATIVGGPVVPALTMTSAGIIGAKGAFDKNAFFEKSMPYILDRMRAERKRVLAIIRAGLAKVNINEYDLDRALDDVNEYFQVGSIKGALFAISQDAGVVAKEADRKIEIAMKSRPAENVSPERQKRVDSLIDKINALSDRSKIFSLISAPPVPDDADLERVIQSRDSKNLRLTDPNVAKEMIRVRLIYSQREDSQLNAWEAAIIGAK